MNNQIYQSSNCKPTIPTNLGWLEYRLGQQEIDHLWKCIDNKKQEITDKLAGNITSSCNIIDTDDWFYNNVLSFLVSDYEKTFPPALNHSLRERVYESDSESCMTINSPPVELFCNQLWVNYQNKLEFNPLHCHSGIYSFVIWMNIPTYHKEENKDNPSNTPIKSSFDFICSNILGEVIHYPYDLDPSYNGMLLFFPSSLSHQVYPFYTSDEQRVSISGNISFKLVDPSLKDNEDWNHSRNIKPINKKSTVFGDDKLYVSFSDVD